MSAETRFSIAAALMRPPAADANEAKARIKRMQAPERETLRELVDWVEDYDAERAAMKQAGRP